MLFVYGIVHVEINRYYYTRIYTLIFACTTHHMLYTSTLQPIDL